MDYKFRIRMQREDDNILTVITEDIIGFSVLENYKVISQDLYYGKDFEDNDIFVGDLLKVETMDDGFFVSTLYFDNQWFYVKDNAGRCKHPNEYMIYLYNPKLDRIS